LRPAGVRSGSPGNPEFYAETSTSEESRPPDGSSKCSAARSARPSARVPATRTGALCARNCRSTRGAYQGRRRARRRTVEDAARCGLRPIVGAVGEVQRAHEEDRRADRRRARQEVRAAGRAEQASGRSAAERGAHVRALAVLDQHQADHDQRGHDLQGQHEGDDDVHALRLSPRVLVFSSLRGRSR
jgi:hypothetical protein